MRDPVAREREVRFMCQQQVPQGPPADVDADAFDELLTGSMQSDEPASAFTPIPGSLPDPNDP
eukprot:2981764-Karenia_brevis.AAC.1